MNPLTLFTIGDGPTLFPGYDSGKRWNGWAVPLFPISSCEAIAREFRAEDGSPIFRFDPATRCWMQAPTEGCEEDGEWPSAPVMVDGVECWNLGDGYVWDRVDLEETTEDGLTCLYYADGAPIPPSSIPIQARVAILWEIREGAASGSLLFNGTTYTWE